MLGTDKALSVQLDSHLTHKPIIFQNSRTHSHLNPGLKPHFLSPACWCMVKTIYSFWTPSAVRSECTVCVLFSTRIPFRGPEGRRQNRSNKLTEAQKACQPERRDEALVPVLLLISSVGGKRCCGSGQPPLLGGTFLSLVRLKRALF